jgi:hypothetical protein
MSPIFCRCACVSMAERCVGICGHPFFPGRKKHKSGCCLCVQGGRVNGMSIAKSIADSKSMVFSW